MEVNNNEFTSRWRTNIVWAIDKSDLMFSAVINEVSFGHCDNKPKAG